MTLLKKHSSLLFVLVVAVLLMIAWIQMKNYWDYQSYLKYRKPLVVVEVRDKDPYIDERGFIRQAPLLSNIPVKLFYRGEHRYCLEVVGYDCPGPLNIVLKSESDDNGLAYFYDIDIDPIITDRDIDKGLCITCALQVYIDDDEYKSGAIDLDYRKMIDGFYLDNPIKLEYGAEE